MITFLIKQLFICFWFHCRLSLVVASGGLSLPTVLGILTVEAPLVAERGLWGSQASFVWVIV